MKISIPFIPVIYGYILFFLMFIFETEREHEWGRGRERGRHRIGSRLQALSHQPRARRGARTPGPRDRDLAEVGRLTDCATQAPQPADPLKRKDFWDAWMPQWVKNDGL